MRHAHEDTPVSLEDVLDYRERSMRFHLKLARINFEWAKSVFDESDNLDPEAQADLWGRFNATERRLMKGDPKEWS